MEAIPNKIDWSKPDENKETCRVEGGNEILPDGNSNVTGKSTTDLQEQPKSKRKKRLKSLPKDFALLVSDEDDKYGIGASCASKTSRKNANETGKTLQERSQKLAPHSKLEQSPAPSSTLKAKRIKQKVFAGNVRKLPNVSENDYQPQTIIICRQTKARTINPTRPNYLHTEIRKSNSFNENNFVKKSCLTQRTGRELIAAYPTKSRKRWPSVNCVCFHVSDHRFDENPNCNSNITQSFDSMKPALSQVTAALNPRSRTSSPQSQKKGTNQNIEVKSISKTSLISAKNAKSKTTGTQSQSVERLKSASYSQVNETDSNFTDQDLKTQQSSNVSFNSSKTSISNTKDAGNVREKLLSVHRNELAEAASSTSADSIISAKSYKSDSKSEKSARAKNKVHYKNKKSYMRNFLKNFTRGTQKQNEKTTKEEKPYLLTKRGKSLEKQLQQRAPPPFPRVHGFTPDVLAHFKCGRLKQREQEITKETKKIIKKSKNKQSLQASTSKVKTVNGVKSEDTKKTEDDGSKTHVLTSEEDDKNYSKRRCCKFLKSLPPTPRETFRKNPGSPYYYPAPGYRRAWNYELKLKQLRRLEQERQRLCAQQRSIPYNGPPRKHQDFFEDTPLEDQCCCDSRKKTKPDPTSFESNNGDPHQYPTVAGFRHFFDKIDEFKARETELAELRKECEETFPEIKSLLNREVCCCLSKATGIVNEDFYNNAGDPHRQPTDAAFRHSFEYINKKKERLRKPKSVYAEIVQFGTQMETEDASVSFLKQMMKDGTKEEKEEARLTLEQITMEAKETRTENLKDVCQCPQIQKILIMVEESVCDDQEIYVPCTIEEISEFGSSPGMEYPEYLDNWQTQPMGEFTTIDYPMDLNNSISLPEVEFKVQTQEPQKEKSHVKTANKEERKLKTIKKSKNYSKDKNESSEKSDVPSEALTKEIVQESVQEQGDGKKRKTKSARNEKHAKYQEISKEEKNCIKSLQPPKCKIKPKCVCFSDLKPSMKKYMESCIQEQIHKLINMTEESKKKCKEQDKEEEFHSKKHNVGKHQAPKEKRKSDIKRESIHSETQANKETKKNKSKDPEKLERKKVHGT